MQGEARHRKKEHYKRRWVVVSVKKCVETVERNVIAVILAAKLDANKMIWVIFAP